ncbi:MULTISPECIES: aldo/keto reductase [Enterococcus]|uniref:Aldo/keto reductase n=1 Tax=Enterococcus alishanensis TaxID=1303817 RepID=A0ABS6TDF5_9ENTE|nr:aldo/keto reductase [Enterococcus alishanensis]MBV7390912.1 aldo/keto reductase [Enterococcus alishanensis]
MLKETYTLSNEVKIPKIGFGTWMIPDEKAEKAVIEAIEVGYRHIDTAQAYENEVGVGAGIRHSGIPREELFLTTKLAAEIKNYDGAVAAIEESLNKLAIGYIDLMIIHSPKPWANFQEEANHYFDGNLAAWKALEEAYEVGKIKAIGVSNFEQIDLENIINNGKIKPMVDQVLAHIGHTPVALIDFAQKNDILVEAYSPIAHGEMMSNPEITALAEKYQVSIPQLAVRYLLQLDLLPLPKTEKIAHMKNNADVDFEISAEDMATLKNIGKIDYGSSTDIPVFRRATDK